MSAISLCLQTYNSLTFMNADKRLYYLDFLRVLAIIAVLVLHSSADIIFNSEIRFTRQWYLAWAYDNLFRWCVVMFIMISGILFTQNSSAEFDPKSYLSKKVGRLIVPFIVWSLFYLIWKERFNPNFFQETSIGKIIREILAGPTYFHLWFMYMILGLYLIGPVLAQILKNDSNSIYLKYFLFIWFIFISVREFFHKATGVYIRVDLEYLTGALPYAVLGHFLNNMLLTKRVAALSAIIFVFSTLVTYFMNIYTIKTTGQMEVFYLGYPSPNATLQAGSLFLFMKYIHLNFLEKYERLNTFFATISGLVFGIYFIHPYILEQMKIGIMGIKLNVSSFSAIPGITIVIITCFIISSGLCYLFSLVPILKKLLT